MKCGYAECQVEIPDGTKVKGKDKRFCCAKHRKLAWMDAHVIKRKHPKRIRSRERDRLYTIIHKGESIQELFMAAAKKFPELLDQPCAGCGHKRKDHVGLFGFCSGVNLYRAPHVCDCKAFKRRETIVQLCEKARETALAAKDFKPVVE